MKQTAVEWFIEQLEEKGGSWENVSIERIQISITVEEYLELQTQAKAMEKEQIFEAWHNGFANGYDLGKYNDECSPEDAEQYYTETYESKTNI